MTEERIRGVWLPDPDAVSVNRRGEMALAYRQAAMAERERADRLQKLLAQVDLQAVKVDDPDLAERVAALIVETAPDLVHDLDVQFAEWGERWHVDEVPQLEEYRDTDWVTTSIVNELTGVSMKEIGQARIKGKLEKYRHLNNVVGYIYQAGEALKIRDVMPGRGNFPHPKGDQHWRTGQRGPRKPAKATKAATKKGRK